MNKPPYNPQSQNTQPATVPAQGPNAQHAGKKKVNPKVVAGAAAGAAVLGVGATAAAMGLGGHDDNNDDDIDVNAEEIEIGDSALNPDQPANGTFQFGNGHADSQSGTSAPAHHQSSASHANPPAAGNHTPTQEEQHIGSHTPGQQEQHVTIQNDEEVNPAEIISITEVDDNDNDMPELLEFEEPEYVQDDAGNIQVHADFTLEGETFTMIDVDGDGTFDGIDNGDGTMAEVNVGGLMVSDVEMMTHENDHDYLAANELDNNSDVNGVGESSADDTILV